MKGKTPTVSFGEPPGSIGIVFLIVASDSPTSISSTKDFKKAFCSATLVPGIEFSADKLLQGRIFSYNDTQRHRLGPNYLQLPINRPVVPVANNQRDGSMQTGSFSGPVNYEPNTFGGGLPKEAPATSAEVYRIEGDVNRKKFRLTNDFEQAGQKYRSMGKVEREHLIDNIVDSLGKAEK
jgi:catalase